MTTPRPGTAALPPARPGWGRRSLGVLFLVAFVLAGCGDKPKTPGVAGLGSTPPATAQLPSGGLPANFMSKLLAYAKCMRAHGISDFPDPTPGPGGQGGGFRISATSGSDLDPNNAEYKAANRACQSRLPFGGSPPPVTGAQLVAENKLSACMRTHGFPSFPDPNGQGVLVLRNIDVGSEQFQSAMRTCRALVKFNGPLRVNAVGPGPPPSAGH